MITVTFYSCEEQVDWDFQSQENGVLVVDAIITDEFKKQEVFLSLSYDELNGQPTPVTNASIRMTDGLNSVEFLPDWNNPGNYLSRFPFSAQLHVPYTLEIDWNGSNYRAENSMVEVLPFNKLTFNKAGGTDSLQLGEVAPLYLPYEQAMYEVIVYWAHLVDTRPAWAQFFFYTFNTLDVSEIFRPEKETISFPKGSIVIQKKYSLNPEFAAYLRALLMETEWQGGVFDEASSSLPTNISNGGLGFFAVCAVRSDTLVAQ